MKTAEIQYYMGTITKVLNQETYEIEFNVPGVIEAGRGFPLRGEIDEPQKGNLILVRSLDPAYGSYFLYSKLKENGFIGFRSLGKMISVKKEYIEIASFDQSIQDYPDEAEIDDSQDNIITSIKIYDTGVIEIKSGNDINITGDSKINIKNKSDISVKSDTKIDLESTGDLTIKSKATLNLEGTGVNIKGTNVQIKGPGTFKINGYPPANPAGPFFNAPTIPYPATPSPTTNSLILT